VPISAEVLDQLARLEGQVAGVRNAIDAVLVASREPDSPLTVEIAIAEVEKSAEEWLAVTAELEARILAHGDPADEDDVQARVGGIALLHTSVAADVAALQPLDELEPGLPVSSATLPEEVTTLQAAAFGEGGLVAALVQPLEENDDGEDNDDGADGQRGDDTDGGDTNGGAKDDSRGTSRAFDPDVDDVVSDLTNRAGAAGTAVLFGLAGGVGHLFSDLLPHLQPALDRTPGEVRTAVGRIGGIVRRCISRVDSLMDTVLKGYRPTVSAIVDEADPASLVTETLAGHVIGRILRADEVRVEASRRLRAAGAPRKRIRRLRRLAKSHHRWVGPVRVVSKGLPHLWAVPIGPVPAAPIAAVVLLAWTAILTSDQLDAPRAPLDIWKGVIRRAAGE
jgi:hypothetical protein